MKNFLKKCPLVTITIIIAMMAATALAFQQASANKEPESDLPDIVQTHDTETSSGAATDAAAVKKPLSSVQPAGKDYFNSALFIGDSITEGISQYGTLRNARYFCRVGLSLHQLFERPKLDSRYKLTLEQTLRRKQFRSVYILLGVNEAGVGNTQYFVRHYRAAIEKVKKLQPQAVIYVQSMLLVTRSRAGRPGSVTNDNIRTRNKGLMTLDDGRSVFYLDLTPAVNDGQGNMPDSFSGDGVHLKAKYYPRLCDRIRKATAEALAAAGLPLR